MPHLGVIDLVAGLIFVFGVTTALSSVVTELVSRLAGLRGAYLLGGLSELVDGGERGTVLADAEVAYHDAQSAIRGIAASAVMMPSATAALLGGPVLRGQISGRELMLVPAGKVGRVIRLRSNRGPRNLWSQCRSVPGRITAGSFAEAVIDVVVPDQADRMTMAAIERNVEALPASMSSFKASLLALAKNAGDDTGRFSAGIESWFDDHMDRVSGWYKRRVAMITLVAGTILILLVNVNVLTIGRALYSGSTVSAAVSAVAAKGASCPVGRTRPECLASLQAQLSATAAPALPLGWGTVRDCAEPQARCNWLDQRGIFSRHGNSGWQLVSVLTGFLLMMVALVPGARFWFALLSKFGSIGAAGPAGRAARSRDLHRPRPAAVTETATGDSRGPVRAGSDTGHGGQRPDDGGPGKRHMPKLPSAKRLAAAGSVVAAAVAGGVAAAEVTALAWLGALTATGTVLVGFGIYTVAAVPGGRWWSRRRLEPLSSPGGPSPEAVGDVWGGAVSEAEDYLDQGGGTGPRVPAGSGDGRADGPEAAFSVNAFVSLAGRDVRVPDMPLELRTDYEILCSIGLPDLRSSLRGSDAVFPRGLLPEGDLELRAVLQVEGLREPEIRTLKISGENRVAGWVRLPLPAAQSPATIRAHLAIYYEVVAVYVEAFMVPFGGPARSRGPRARLVYRLSTPFTKLGELAGRQASVIVSDQIKTSVLVNGVNLAPNAYEISDNAADSAADVARDKMYNIHFFKVAGNGEEISRYSPRAEKGVKRHGKDSAKFTRDLAELASAGQIMYDALFRDNTVVGTLPDLLRQETRAHDRVPVIQVVDARVLPIPWALLYDLPFGDSGPYEECDSIGEFGPGGKEQRDIPARCPYEQRHRAPDGRWLENQLCPWGFWGLSAVLEQPPDVRNRSLESVISDDPSLPRAFLMASGPGLDPGLREEHIKELDRQAPKAWTYPPIAVAQDLKAALTPETMDIVYFYCHCDYTEAAPAVGLKPYLRFDAAQAITPSVISTWARTGWPKPQLLARHPLVVINGCRTAERKSSSLTGFVDAFANRAGAAGVIGTEIPIDQAIASWAMGLFFDAVCQGATVGMALRHTRWAMFGRGNLMGFAYTPHCLANLTLRRVTEPQERTA